MQLSRPESAISVFKTTKRDTERVNLQDLHSGIEHREVYSMSLLAQSFQSSKRKVSTKLWAVEKRLCGLCEQ